MKVEKSVLYALGTFLLLTAVALGVRYLVIREEVRDIQRDTTIATARIVTYLEDFLATRLKIGAHLQGEFLKGRITSRADFVEVASNLQRLFPGYQAIARIDRTGAVRWIVPEQDDRPARDFNVYANSLSGSFFDKAKITNKLQITPPIDLPTGEKGFLGHFPLTKDGRFDGTITVFFDHKRLVHEALRADIFHDYSVSISDAGENIFLRGTEPTDLNLLASGRIRVVDRVWRVYLMPTPMRTVGDLTSYRWLLTLLAILLAILLAAGLSWLLSLYFSRQAAHRDNDERLGDFTNAASDWLWETDKNHRFVYVSLETDVQVAMSSDMLLGKCRWELEGRDEQSPAWRAHRAQMDTHLPFRDFHFSRRLSKGGINHFRVTGRPIFDAAGKFTGYRGTTVDETAEVEAREKMARVLKDTEQLYHTIFNTTAGGCWLIDAADKTVEVNDAMCRLIGYQQEEILGKSPFDFCDKENREILRKKIAAREHVDQGIYELTLTHKNGKPVHVLFNATTWRSPEGDVIGGFAIVIDLTEQKKVEETLRQSEAKYRSLFEWANDPIFIIHPETFAILDVNEKAVRLLGYTRKELLALRTPDIHEPDFEETSRERRLEMERTGVSLYESILVGKDGSKVPVEVNSHIIELTGGRVVQSFVHDMTGRERMEKALHLISRAIEQSPVSISLADAEGRIEYVNPKFTEVTGYNLDEVLGKTQRILKSGHTSHDEYEELWRTILAGGEWQGEFRNKKKNGELFWERAVISPLKSADGTITHFIGIKEDITEQKRLAEERSELEVRLRQAQKMETIGTLAGGIAHDLNNILTPIFGCVEFALDEVPEEGQLRDDLMTIQNAARRAEGVVNQILAFSRQSEDSRQTLDLREIVGEALDLLAATVPANIEIRRSLNEECPPVSADPTQMHQIIMNLGVNAQLAMAESDGLLDVAVDSFVVDARFAESHTNLRPGPYARLSVRDTGVGMDAATRERIFEPFFTTRDVGQGTGLGLSMVHGIVLAHGGEIMVESELGRGTVFRIYLPLAADADRKKNDLAGY